MGLLFLFPEAKAELLKSIKLITESALADFWQKQQCDHYFGSSL